MITTKLNMEVCKRCRNEYSVKYGKDEDWTWDDVDEGSWFFGEVRCPINGLIHITVPVGCQYAPHIQCSYEFEHMVISQNETE